ncbi:copper chaperone PCu(A)C [Corynebacterium sp. USCH3]|uniref:copper chaperone PCu(A)C n=1 Tax=Corynebacterium sp. USCH3 TaxID=3024840 RepID=UPI0030A51D75
MSVSDFPAVLSTRSARALSAAALAAVVAVGVTACGDDGSAGDAASSTAASTAADDTTDGAAEAAEGAVTLEDGYVGAKDADTSMTAVFGELTNHTDEDIHLTRVAGDLPAVYQYHEVVDGVMRETDDGLVIPANGSVQMEPGGHHIMIMENNDDIAAGDVLTLTLTADDGTTYELKDVPVRVQQSGHEDYAPGEMDGMDMGEMGDMDHSEDGDHAGH